MSRQCLVSGEEDVAVIAFEIFDELIESPAPLLGDSVKSIVQFSLEVCSSQNLEANTRHQVRNEQDVYFYCVRTLGSAGCWDGGTLSFTSVLMFHLAYFLCLM